MAHAASSDVTSAELRGKFGRELQYIMQHTACSRQRRDMWVGSFFLVWNASSPIIIKKLKMYVYFFTNPASSPFKRRPYFLTSDLYCISESCLYVSLLKVCRPVFLPEIVVAGTFNGHTCSLYTRININWSHYKMTMLSGKLLKHNVMRLGYNLNSTPFRRTVNYVESWQANQRWINVVFSTFSYRRENDYPHRWFNGEC